jgi:hypothetical protein
VLTECDEHSRRRTISISFKKICLPHPGRAQS